MKKIVLSLFVLFCMVPVFADSAPITEEEAMQVEEFFDSYVESANNYRDDLTEKYADNAVIKRIVIKKDGSKQDVTIPIQRYFKELKSGQKTARLVRYKNRYINKKYSKISNGEYKITTTRIPFRDKTGLRAEFKIIETPDGLKISEELMETNVQRFLKEK
ncbi:MAG: hypothetical protein LUE64_07365 [Candidatus Gastranaerophilales bacterium]|nr:hypothetical protein [Candidatus Gastranaerophilales bacterium]